MAAGLTTGRSFPTGAEVRAPGSRATLANDPRVRSHRLTTTGIPENEDARRIHQEAFNHSSVHWLVLLRKPVKVSLKLEPVLCRSAWKSAIS